jgi:hypothetical protein
MCDIDVRWLSLTHWAKQRTREVRISQVYRIPHLSVMDRRIQCSQLHGSIASFQWRCEYYTIFSASDLAPGRSALRSGDLCVLSILDALSHIVELLSLHTLVDEQKFHDESRFVKWFMLLKSTQLSQGPHSASIWCLYLILVCWCNALAR